jgi:hypothetical protein
MWLSLIIIIIVCFQIQRFWENYHIYEKWKEKKCKKIRKKWKILCLTLYGTDINCIKFLFSTIIIGLIIGSLKQGPESEYCKILQGHNVVYLH